MGNGSIYRCKTVISSESYQFGKQDSPMIDTSYVRSFALYQQNECISSEEPQDSSKKNPRDLLVFPPNSFHNNKNAIYVVLVCLILSLYELVGFDCSLLS